MTVPTLNILFEGKVEVDDCWMLLLTVVHQLCSKGVLCLISCLLKEFIDYFWTLFMEYSCL